MSARILAIDRRSYLVAPSAAAACRTLFKRVRNAVIWTLLAMLVFGGILGLAYGINGYVEYDTTLLTSGVAPFDEAQTFFSGNGCIQGERTPGANITATSCSALADSVQTQTWEQRPSFLIYVIAVASILGWILLMVMAGVGIVALPLDMILACVPAPRPCLAACCCSVLADERSSRLAKARSYPKVYF